MGRGGKNNKKRIDGSAAVNEEDVNLNEELRTSFTGESAMSVAVFNTRTAALKEKYSQLVGKAALYRNREHDLESERVSVEQKLEKHTTELAAAQEEHSVATAKLLSLERLLKQLTERMNKTELALKEEVSKEKMVRHEISKEFSKTLEGVSVSLEQLNGSRERIVMENIELKETLKNYLEEFDRYNDSDVPSSENGEKNQKEWEFEEELKREEEGRLMTHEDNTVKLGTLQQIEAEFAKQLTEYSAMFDVFQQRLGVSNEAFKKNQREMEILTKLIKDKEAENKQLVGKIAASSPATKSLVARYNVRLSEKAKQEKALLMYRNLAETLNAEISSLQAELA